MAECWFCLQDIPEGEEFCPGGACRGSWNLLFGKAEDVVYDDDVYDDDGSLTLPLTP